MSRRASMSVIHWENQIDMGSVAWSGPRTASGGFVHFGASRFLPTNKQLKIARIEDYRYVGSKNGNYLKDKEFSTGSYGYGPSGIQIRDDRATTLEEFKALMQGKTLYFNYEQ